MTITVKRVMKASYLTGAAIAFALLLRRQADWASGLMIGIIWCVTNFSLTVDLFETALLRRDPKKLKQALIIKFPVLYLTGFFLLKCKFFPLMSLLSGIGIALLTIGIVSIWPKQA